MLLVLVLMSVFSYWLSAMDVHYRWATDKVDSGNGASADGSGSADGSHIANSSSVLINSCQCEIKSSRLHGDWLAASISMH